MVSSGPRAASREPQADGVLVVDKPVGPTSHDVVARVRRVSACRRVGHTGTLDPLASGVLPLVLGRATRLARFLSGSDKTYEATVRLGFATDTYDAEGQPVETGPRAPVPGLASIESAARAFLGEFDQTPPVYSAKKVGGVAAHRLARRERAVVLAPAHVRLHAIEVLGCEADLVRLRLSCSAGFYVRSLAHDLGVALGCGGHLVQLRRTRAGDFALDAAVPLDHLADARAVEAALTPLDRLLPGLPAAGLTPAGAVRATHGQLLGPDDIASMRGARDPAWSGSASWDPASAGFVGHGPVRLVDPEGHLLGIAEVAGTGGSGLSLHPAIVLV
jgi:tRNA pseudouridine55 synthase